jgi:N-acetylmuramoyl-L-alanine amidase
MWRSKVVVISRSKFYIATALIFLTVLLVGSLRFGIEVDYQVLSYAVAQKVVVIDPGHGGIDPGATGPNNTLEKDINLEIARRLAQYLSQAGAVVILTRETDSDLADEGFQGSLLERKRQDLARRLAKAQTNRADLYVSIHCNADVSPRWAGAQVFYCDNSEEGKKIAQSIQS